MSRDHRKLRVFELADGLVLDVYAVTKGFPCEEMFGLTSQLRRGALSVPTNIVEGCARRTERDYGSFLNIAFGSTREVIYLLTVVQRLGYLDAMTARRLDEGYNDVARGLVGLMRSLGQ